MAIVSGLVVPVLWLWMARANGRGRNWTRIVSTVLFAVATLQLPGAFAALVIPVVFGAWLIGSTPRRADLAGRPGRGVAVVAPGLQRVLQAAGLPARRAQRPAVFTD